MEIEPRAVWLLNLCSLRDSLSQAGSLLKLRQLQQSLGVLACEIREGDGNEEMDRSFIRLINTNAYNVSSSVEALGIEEGTSQKIPIQSIKGKTMNR